jgi:hypothetical protein
MADGQEHLQFRITGMAEAQQTMGYAPRSTTPSGQPGGRATRLPIPEISEICSPESAPKAIQHLMYEFYLTP